MRPPASIKERALKIVGSRAVSESVMMRVRLALMSASPTTYCLERLERGCNILGSPDFEWRDFDAKPASHGLNLGHLQHALGKVSISYDCQPAEPGENLTQEFETLAGNIGRLSRQSSDVAAWSRQACDYACADRV